MGIFWNLDRIDYHRTGCVTLSLAARIGTGRHGQGRVDILLSGFSLDNGLILGGALQCIPPPGLVWVPLLEYRAFLSIFSISPSAATASLTASSSSRWSKRAARFLRRFSLSMRFCFLRAIEHCCSSVFSPRRWRSRINASVLRFIFSSSSRNTSGCWAVALDASGCCDYDTM